MTKQRASFLSATTWWALGTSLALDASLVSKPWLLLVLIAFSFTILIAFTPSERRASALKLYGFLSASILLIRLLFRVIFNQAIVGDSVALKLPTISLSLGGQELHFLGAVSWLNLNAAFTDGLRLCAIIMGFGLANSIANPRKLLRSTPSALYEVATAAAVAINLAPQFAVSLKRISKARQLRGQAKGFKSFTGIVVPLLEDTVQRSLDLAASMDARGFGRRGKQSAFLANTSRFTSMVGLVAMAIAVYLLLASDSPIWMAALLVLASMIAFVITIRIAGNQSTRSRLVLETRTWRDYLALVASLALLLLLAAFRVPNFGLNQLSLLGWLK
jgi:energy-coupling factor transport system permease protein